MKFFIPLLSLIACAPEIPQEETPEIPPDPSELWGTWSLLETPTTILDIQPDGRYSLDYVMRSGYNNVRVIDEGTWTSDGGKIEIFHTLTTWTDDYENFPRRIEYRGEWDRVWENDIPYLTLDLGHEFEEKIYVDEVPIFRDTDF